MQKTAAANEIPNWVKLSIAAAGIYGSYLNYGLYQDQVMKYRTTLTPAATKSGLKPESFNHVWFLNFLEALVSAVVAALGYFIFKSNKVQDLPHKFLAAASFTQTMAKFGMNMSLVHGVSYAVSTLAKSAKAAPVMIAMLVAGKTYEAVQYLSVKDIILGTILVSWKSGGDSKGHGHGGGGKSQSMLGVAFIMLSLVCDGLTGYTQGLSKNAMKDKKLTEQPHENMFFTNLYMAIIGCSLSLFYGQFFEGIAFCQANPLVLEKIAYFCICSAVGQIFIFYTITNFDSLTSTTITTTRKIFTVLLAIWTDYKNNPMDVVNWIGLGNAVIGISFEVLEKVGGHGKKAEQKPKSENPEDSKKEK